MEAFVSATVVWLLAAKEIGRETTDLQGGGSGPEQPAGAHCRPQRLAARPLSLLLLLVGWLVLILPRQLWEAAHRLLGRPPTRAASTKSITFSPLPLPHVDAWGIVLLGGMDRVQPSGIAMRSFYRSLADRILELEVREDDVWVLSFPRSGTTWTTEMTWLLTHDFDLDRARKTNIDHRTFWLEKPQIEMIPGWKLNEDGIDEIAQQSSPRCIYSHLPPELLPRQLWSKRPKILYVAREPKDVIVSDFHHYKDRFAYSGSLESFVDDFIDDRVMYAPWWKHVLRYWQMRNEPNVLFNRYEDMKKDLPAVIRRTAAFLGRAVTEEQVALLAEHLSFSSMKQNKNANPMNRHPVARLVGSKAFIRRGEAGGWRRDMSEDLAARVDAWARERLQGTGYPWP